MIALPCRRCLRAHAMSIWQLSRCLSRLRPCRSAGPLVVGSLTLDPCSLPQPRSLHSDAAGAQHEDASPSGATAAGAVQAGSSSSNQGGLLMRDFIHQSLYHPVRRSWTIACSTCTATCTSLHHACVGTTWQQGTTSQCPCTHGPDIKVWLK